MSKSTIRIVSLTIILLAIAIYYLLQNNYFNPSVFDISPTRTNSESNKITVTPKTFKSQIINLYFVALEDNGKSGENIGCNDSLVPVKQEIPLTDSPAALGIQKMLEYPNQYYGESGYFNALYQSDLTLENISVIQGKADVYLKGRLVLSGVCDNPRVKAQLEETVLQFPAITSVEFYINDKPLGEYLSGKGE